MTEPTCESRAEGVMVSRKKGLQALVYNEFQARLDQSEILPKKGGRDEEKEDEEEKEK